MTEVNPSTYPCGMTTDLIDRVFDDLRACRIDNDEALASIAAIRSGTDPYEGEQNP